MSIKYIELASHLLPIVNNIYNNTHLKHIIYDKKSKT